MSNVENVFWKLGGKFNDVAKHENSFRKKRDTHIQNNAESRQN